MPDFYQPPFTMTEEITNLVIEIAEFVGALTAYDTLRTDPVLRRESRVRTIHSSLAIEQNTLSLEQVTDVIAGKRILGPPQDIREVKNAYEAYEQASDLDPYDIDHLLLAHRLMMGGLDQEAGRFRGGNVGVYAGEQLIHAGTPARYVPKLIDDLFTWLRESKLHPLVKSCIFHYEFEFIHPFADGNGRTGRLWQSLILQKWQPFFAWLPVETLIHENQEGYYRALNQSNTESDSSAFVAFMLRTIRDALREIPTEQANHVGVNVGKNVGIKTEEKILSLLRMDPKLTANQLSTKVGLTKRQVERILARLKQEGRLLRHGAAKNGYWEVV